MEFQSPKWGRGGIFCWCLNGSSYRKKSTKEDSRQAVSPFFPCSEKLTRACFLNKFLSLKAFRKTVTLTNKEALQQISTFECTCCLHNLGSNCQNHGPPGATESECRQLGLHHFDFLSSTSSPITLASTPTSHSTGAPPKCAFCLSD